MTKDTLTRWLRIIGLSYVCVFSSIGVYSSIISDTFGYKAGHVHYVPTSGERLYFFGISLCGLLLGAYFLMTEVRELMRSRKMYKRKGDNSIVEDNSGIDPRELDDTR